MKKGIAVSLMVLFGLMWSATAFSNEYDFRKTNWGVSREEVAETEGALELQYDYTGDKLVSAEYEFSYEATLEYFCINNYRHLKEKLAEKYGKAVVDEDIWIDDLYKDDFSNWGKAVAQNHLLRYAQWETPNTRITIVLAGDGYGDIALKIKYRSQQIKELEEESAAKEILEVF